MASCDFKNKIYKIMKRIIVVCCMFISFSAIAQKSPEGRGIHRDAVSSGAWRIAFGGGGVFRLGGCAKEKDAGLDKFARKFSRGFGIDGDIQYFFKEKWGLGINANYVRMHSSDRYAPVPKLGGLGNITETQDVFYIGPAFVSRLDTEKFLLVGSCGAGIFRFVDKMRVEAISIREAKFAVGLNLGISGEYKVTESSGLGLKLSYTLGSVSSNRLQPVLNDEVKRFISSNLMITAFYSLRLWN